MNEPATVRVAHVEGRPPRQAALCWLALGTFAIAKRPHRAHDPRIVEETRQYLRDFERMAERAPVGTATVRTMLALHPHRVNPGMLWWSARALKA